MEVYKFITYDFTQLIYPQKYKYSIRSLVQYKAARNWMYI